MVVTLENIPDPDDFETQLQYDYETRIGDLDGDGLDDLLVHRTSNEGSLNGVIASLVLMQTALGDFVSVVPTGAQLAIAEMWPIASVPVAVEDFNYDGFVDLHIGDINASISGAMNQFIFSSGH